MEYLSEDDALPTLYKFPLYPRPPPLYPRPPAV